MFERIGSTTYTGVDDTKLFVWPGRGLFAITGRHEEAQDPEGECGQYNWMQYLVQVRRRRVGHPRHGSAVRAATHMPAAWQLPAPLVVFAVRCSPRRGQAMPGT